MVRKTATRKPVMKKTKTKTMVKAVKTKKKGKGGKLMNVMKTMKTRGRYM